MMIQVNAQATGLAARAFNAPRIAYSVTVLGLRRSTLS